MANKINHDLYPHLVFQLLIKPRKKFDELRAQGWSFHVVDSKRGYCSYRNKEIAIPSWVFNETSIRRQYGKLNIEFWSGNQIRDYVNYYVSHEMAHAFAGASANHGPIFMAKFKEICPEHCQIFEHGYKPRNAKLAGIPGLKDEII